MFGDDAVAYREPQTGAFRFGGEEGVEDPRHEFRRNAAAIVLYGHPQTLAGVHLLKIMGGAELGRDRDHAVLAFYRDGLNGVGDQVKQHLLDLIGIGGGLGQ